MKNRPILIAAVMTVTLVTAMSDGFIPFEGLGRMERCAEVVGHELAHAALHLEDPGYARICRDLEIEWAALLASRGRNRRGNLLNQEALYRLARIKFLTEKAEQPA